MRIKEYYNWTLCTLTMWHTQQVIYMLNDSVFSSIKTDYELKLYSTNYTASNNLYLIFIIGPRWPSTKCLE